MVAAVIGFALGWQLYVLANAKRLANEREDMEALRSALSEAQVRRAREP
ncbi:MAG: hypothetical protein R3C16_05670 [Hyphomonadaceae bacterium]